MKTEKNGQMMLSYDRTMSLYADEADIIGNYRLLSASQKADIFAYMARAVNAEAESYGRAVPENDDYLCCACLSAEPLTMAVEEPPTLPITEPVDLIGIFRRDLRTAGIYALSGEDGIQLCYRTDKPCEVDLLMYAMLEEIVGLPLKASRALQRKHRKHIDEARADFIRLLDCAKKPGRVIRFAKEEM